MSNAELTVWMPSIRGGSGGDVFVERLADALRRLGVAVVVEWFDSRYEFAPHLLRRVRTPDGTTVIHANAVCAFAFAGRGLPLVVTEHHYVLDPAYRRYKSTWQALYHRLILGPSLKRSIRSADAVTVPTEFTRRVIATAFPGSAPEVIPLWADYNVFRSRLEPMRPSSAPFRLLFVGNLSKRKGADILKPLLERLGSGFEIFCTGGLRGGTGPFKMRGLRFLGKLSTEELVSAYAASDAVLVPSRYEGFGYAALEAMACERPVIAFACGAVDEVLVDGETGFLVPVDDLESLTSVARRLRDDVELCQRLGRAGRKRALDCFSEERAAASYLSMYLRLALAGLPPGTSAAA